ncbi:unnamed protein product [Musa banksii]
MRTFEAEMEEDGIIMAGKMDEELDDDGRPRRTGTVWTASSHIVTAVIGSGVLSLAWAMAQLGWIAGPLALALFALITVYTSSLLADCYRTEDPISGMRNVTYMRAVKSNLGGNKIWLCGLCQYVNLFGVSIGYTITAGLSAAAVSKSNCFHKKGQEAACSISTNVFMVGYGIIQIFLSQLPNFHKLWWLSIVAAVMSFAYSFIAVGLSAARIISGNTRKTSITGTIVGVDVSASQKVWSTFQALGDIAFSYSYSMILIEIQDTLRSPPAENKEMKKASLIGVVTTTTFYMLCGCLGYSAFGNQAPGNILTGFGFYEPYWLIDVGNVCIVAHLVGAYQVYCQPLFAAVETWFARKCPGLQILTHEHPITINKNLGCNINIFRLLWRTTFVVISTVLAMLMPFFNDVLSLLGAVGFWPLTVYFPIEMYISRNHIARSSPKWMLLQSLSFLCFLVSLAAACGSIEGVAQSLQHYSPFTSKT